MRNIVAIFLFLLASPALAEVSDKAASQVQLWSLGAIVGGIALLAGLVRPLLGLIIGVSVGLFFAAGHFSTFSDPYIGVALLSEQGEAYRMASYACFILPVVGAVAGAWRGLRSRDLLGVRRVAS